MNEPNFLTRMKLSECWGYSLNAEELKELNDYIEKIKQENQQLKEQLQQRDEVIEECIESIQNFMTHIDDGFCADMMTFIDILNKYKGDKMETSLNVIDYPEPKEQKCYVFECECVCNGKFYVYADSEEEALSRLDVGDYDDKEYDDIKIENIVEVSNE